MGLSHPSWCKARVKGVLVQLAVGWKARSLQGCLTLEMQPWDLMELCSQLSVRCGAGAPQEAGGCVVLQQLGCVPAGWQELCSAVGHKGSAVRGLSVWIALGETW